jgi:hypothetical protein
MKRTTAVIVSAGMLAAGLVAMDGATYATTGESLILGKINHADQATTIVRTGAGPALNLHTRRSTAPFKINSHGKVKHLNADAIDGKTSTELQTRVIRYGLPSDGSFVSEVTYRLGGLRKGIYQLTYDVVVELDTSGEQVGCEIVTAGGTQQLPGFGSPFFIGASMTGAGVVDLRQHARASLHCLAFGGNMQIHSQGSMVTMTRADHLIRRAASQAKRPARTPPLLRSLSSSRR